MLQLLEEPRFLSPKHYLPFVTFKIGCLRSHIHKWTDGSGCGAAAHIAHCSHSYPVHCLTARTFLVLAWGGSNGQAKGPLAPA